MKRYERDIAIIDDLILKIKEKANQSDINIQTVNDLFKLKMHHVDMIKLHQLQLNAIQVILEQEEILESESSAKIVDFEYRTKEFWRRQVDFMLNKMERPLKSQDIMDSCPVNPVQRRQCMSILSNVLAEMCVKRLVKKFKIEGEKGFYYALPDMVIKKG